MTFDIEIPQDGATRIEIAEKFVAEYSTSRKQGYSVTIVGDHAVVDDGADCWVCTKDDYEAACQSVVDEIIAGDHDGWYGPDDDGVTPYDVLCQSSEIRLLYSNLGGVSDQDWFSGLSPDEQESLSEECGEAFCDEFGRDQ